MKRYAEKLLKDMLGDSKAEFHEGQWEAGREDHRHPDGRPELQFLPRHCRPARPHLPGDAALLLGL